MQPKDSFHLKIGIHVAVLSGVIMAGLLIPVPSSWQVSAQAFQRAAQGYSVKVDDARSTTKTLSGKSKAQIVEATIENNGTGWFTPSHPARVTVQADGVQTTVPAKITELGPGEQTIVEVGIKKKSSSISDGTQVSGTLVAHVTDGNTDRFDFKLTVGIPQYMATDASLSQHEAPDWFDNAKFGIFIHWGVYSVPAWAPVGGVYAEWYWNHMNEKGSPTYDHQLQTYGANANYDDFIPKFTAAKFNPKAWIQLFKQAGARYFVLVTKHHEGFALFNTRYSNRNAVKLGPHKDLLKMLFDAAARYAPDMKRGTYYSLPEWYNPAFHDPTSTFPGGPPTQYVTGQQIPYTGYIPIKDYVQDLQKPQMLELVNNYKTDLLWCDGLGINDSRAVAADLYNLALREGRQVAMNDRCDIPDSDFVTPEYTSFSTLTTHKWESNRGMDPHSYGYNAATPDDAYATADQLITNLVDIVSKNGNLLLDIGPSADGTIREVMQQHLREMGAWLKVNGEAIYDTTYWWRGPQDGDLRFTIRPNHAFYITSLVRPGDQIVVNQPVPIGPRDTVTMLGYRGGALHWSQQSGKLIIDVPSAAQQTGQHAWVFKVIWKSR